jgi:hypothetical protein
MSFDIVTIRVGDPEIATDISVYRELLSAASPYFRAAFDGRFKEARERLLTLNDVSEQTFRLFLTSLHVRDSLPATATCIFTTIRPSLHCFHRV